LREDSRHLERIRELRDVLRPIRLALEREAGHPSVSALRAAQRDLAKGGVVTIALEHFTESMIVRLAGSGGTSGDDRSIPGEELADNAGVVAMCRQ